MFSFGQYDRWHKRLVLELGDLSGKRVLDLCTGTGMVAQRMARGCSEVEVVAADLSAAMLAEAKENLAFEIAKG
ncbi:MAG: methyltransferase domain-containing protein, partial [SAR202 cluster bacterium]|nr:methyltransferase domain-containing protein [SAR202 cluster bacterium]